MSTQKPFFETVGGHSTFDRLVHRFYAGVAEDAPLRAMYPEQDLGPAEDRLRMFLEQYWGGPSTYSEQRGHPRLRMRHAPYPVTHEMRERWLRHMRVALDELLADGTLGVSQAATLWDYLDKAALFMVNTHEDADGVARPERPS